ncbi:hypothetical protein HN011_003457 [Eciton burchellii]|nr:hypothetical protein HN011_003457 [Eciton burchellii]
MTGHNKSKVPCGYADGSFLILDGHKVSSPETSVFVLSNTPISTIFNVESLVFSEKPNENREQPEWRIKSFVWKGGKQGCATNIGKGTKRCTGVIYDVSLRIALSINTPCSIRAGRLFAKILRQEERLRLFLVFNDLKKI